ncbi:PREDICTED: uncharacterized protein LOC108614021 [Drosophila arizonae]|uniref:Uncharacterized protein LOC108614021 n=1 Tax=Drosophila arizonae TaxID=7263 RepID=A0ABM1P850_DROAR|nr:PREDICTED: uncharacterized protein LOC108614021 [Drosophila arizonae]
MYRTLILVFLISLTQGGILAKRYFGVGRRIANDQLLLKDLQHSRPAGAGQAASVAFNYNIAEPITYIEIVSEEKISAEVKVSYVDTLIVGLVSLVPPGNQSEFEEEFEQSQNLSASFDVVITIFGFNQTILNLNPALLLNRDSHFEGEVKPYDDYEEVEEISQPFESLNHEDSVTKQFDEDSTDSPVFIEDFEHKDKIIEIGERQEGDTLIFETYQTSSGEAKTQSNQTVTFYYIDSDYITYIKFVIFDHYLDKVPTAENYMPPVAEYSHYSASSIKATITDFNVSSLFVQMFVYGYRGVDSPPAKYKPFLEPQKQQIDRTVHLTPLQRMQLLLMTGGQSTQSPQDSDVDDDSEEDATVAPIRPEDMLPDHVPEASIANAVLEQQRAMPQRLYAMLGLMLFAVA